jgi:flagellar motor component MotA
MRTIIGLVVPLAIVLTWIFAGSGNAVYVIVAAAVLMVVVGAKDIADRREQRAKEPRSPISLE